MENRRTVTAQPDAPDFLLCLAVRAKAWLATWARDRADEGPSWLVSLLLHVAILALLFLCPMALSGDRRADWMGAIVTRVEAGNERGLLDGLDDLLSLEN